MSQPRPIQPTVEPSRVGDRVEWADAVTGERRLYTPEPDWLDRPVPGKDSYCGFLVRDGGRERFYRFETYDRMARWCIATGHATADGRGTIVVSESYWR